MSSLIFHTDQDQALIAVDTLATDFDGKPIMFTSKAYVLPHLQMLICGTGLGGFLGRWFIFINDKMIVRGINNLNYFASEKLRDLWKEYLYNEAISYKGTTTIYHFGFSEDTRFLTTYVYRSSKDFKSESLKYGIGVKPECNVESGYEFPKDIPKMMQEQRLIQSNLPLSERIFIGGEMIIYHLARSGFSIYSLGKFDDFNNTQEEIFSNHTNID